jgi:oxygen-independent coproporphyrinogen III oxidase
VAKAGVYIHIPFCERKCTYCNFNTTDFDRSLSVRYVDAVIREIAYWGRELPCQVNPTGTTPDNQIPVDTIYFGGGTPSIIEPGQIAQVIQACKDAFEVDADAEITIEINPATMLKSKAEGWLSAGINRASVGVQSFIDRELHALSRTHNATEARTAVAELRAAGFTNLSLDLIAGLVNQSMSDWKYNLGQALELQPEHLSLYLLEVKDGTQLYSQIKRGLLPSPDDDLAADMYEAICEIAGRGGFEQYEISNFARRPDSLDNGHAPSPYRSRHNMKYWRGAPFIGIGCGAHSYDERSRWWNIKRTETYIESVMETGSAIAERITLSDSDRAVEALFMELRLIDGVDLAAFQVAYGLNVLATYGDDLDRLCDAGLVELDSGRLKLTKRGLVLSNEVFQVFV